MAISTLTIDIPILNWLKNTFAENWIKNNIPTIKLYYLPFGNILIILAVNKLKQIIKIDSLKAFLNVFITFLIIEGIVLFLHLTLKYNYLYGELLFYTKLCLLVWILYLFNKLYYNKIIEVIFMLSFIILIVIKLSIIALIYLDINFIYNIILLKLKNKTNPLAILKINYSNNIYIFIYLKHFLTPFLFMLNLVVLLYYQVNKEKYIKYYTKIKSKAFS